MKRAFALALALTACGADTADTTGTDGQPCTDDSDCDGHCVAPRGDHGCFGLTAGTCTSRPPDGCQCTFRDGQVAILCIN